MDKSENTLTTVQIVLGFASCDFPVFCAIIFPKLHSPYDYLYKPTINISELLTTLNYKIRFILKLA